MTKDHVIELYEILKKQFDSNYTLKMIFNEATVEKMRRMTDSDVEIIKESPYPYQIFRLLANKQYWQDYDEDVLNQVIEIINNTRSNFVRYTTEAAGTLAFLKYQDKEIFDIVSLISQAKGINQAEKAVQLIEDYYSLKDKGKIKELVSLFTNCLDAEIPSSIMGYINNLSDKIRCLDSTLDLIRVLATTKGISQVKNGINVAETRSDSLLLIEDDNERDMAAAKIKPLVSLVTKEKDDYKAKCISKVLNNYELIQKSLAVKMAKIIKKTKGITRAEAAYSVAVNSNLINELSYKNITSLVELVGKTEEEYQACIASIVANERIILEQDKTANLLLTLTRIVSKCRGKEQGTNALRASRTNYILESNNITDLIEIISQAETEYQSDYTLRIVANPILLSSDNIVEIAKKASLVNDGEKLSFSKDEIDEFIKKAVREADWMDDGNVESLYNILDVYDNFWKFFEKHPDEAIDCLNETVSNPQEDINESTNIKIRKKQI